MGPDGAVFVYDWLAHSHLPVLCIFATCTGRIAFLIGNEEKSKKERGKKIGKEKRRVARRKRK